MAVKKRTVKKAAPKVARKTKPAESNGVATPLGAAITKTQAVRNAWDAGVKKNADVVAWVAKEYGLEVHQNYPSIIKSGDKKSGKKSAGKRGRKPGATTKKESFAQTVGSGVAAVIEKAEALIKAAGSHASAQKALEFLKGWHK